MGAKLSGTLFHGAEPIMEIVVTIEPAQDGGYIAYCDELQCVADGETEDEAFENIKEAIGALLNEYGEEIRAKAKDRTHRLLKV